MNIKKLPQSYRKTEDCNSSSDGVYEELLLKPLKTVTSSDPSLCVKITEDSFLSPLKSSENIAKTSSAKNNNTLSINVSKFSERRRSACELDMPVTPRGRSGSIQWIQNVLQNIDDRCRSLLDLRRPSDVAEEGLRKSHEVLEAEQSDTQSQTVGPSSGAGGRRYSENVIGKQKGLLSSGIGHLRDLWKDRNENKRQEPKDIDHVRSDVCPLFTFPRKGDEDELILDALRQAMRKCTSMDPSARPSSTSVFDQLSQILK
ncbi:uncharacterized protein CEXT_7481 [Caerostris extrusa]|uniref:Uncharacterized protein n=1 Tax=Caerostris extrusa TaxID=172846 RepID=A0AAV4W556_CAEEX|nr:uncharacterized protein CEXT_7481 [Caerostris extrusa]